MGRTVDLAGRGQPSVEVDLTTLTMVCFSQTGRRIMHYHAHGDHAAAESAEAPFDQKSVLRRLQFAKSGFVRCSNDENAIIVDPEKIDYLVIEPVKNSSDIVLTIGLPGMRTPHIIQTTAEDAMHLVEVMKRFFHPLMQPLENGQVALLRTAAVRTARFNVQGNKAILDFGRAGKVNLAPNDAAQLQRRLTTTIDNMHVFDHQHGRMMIRPESVIAAIPRDMRDSPPDLLFLMDGQPEPVVASLAFSTIEARDRALLDMWSGIDGFDDLDDNDARHSAAMKIMGIEEVQKRNNPAPLVVEPAQGAPLPMPVPG